MGHWKLIEFFETGNIELYNLDDDIGEENDLAEFLPDTIEMLHQILENWRNSINAPVPSQKNVGFVPLLKYTSFPEEEQLFDAGGNASVSVQLSGECMSTEIDSIIIRIYHKASLYAEHIQKMNFSGGKAPFSFNPELEGSNEKYKFKVYFIRKIIEEVDTIVKDVGVTNFTGIITSFDDDPGMFPQVNIRLNQNTLTYDLTQMNGDENNVRIELRDIRGRLLFSKSAGRFEEKGTIDITGCSQSVYIIGIKLNNLIMSRKLIVSR